MEACQDWNPEAVFLSLQDPEACTCTHTHTHTHTHSGAVGRAVSHLGPSGEKQQQASHSPGLRSGWLRSVEGQTAGPGLLALPRIMGPARRELGSTSPPPCEEILPGTLDTCHLGGTMAAHSNILAWKIPWTEEPSRLQSMQS